ncbi:caspase recruitment domain-containing protein 19 isoform X10 [Lagenorhynchus albirostris]|uniref:caspase recruitment domain-containing protein 19 isoform X10 n=1 Tax=Lagenorhynchus albirostris TaxID=27610 RepID=UPI0028EB464A|nr:caspase recruitment domain-containing protein 19 isoform X10 [Lagenorhynchus albirostris]
MVAHRVRVSRCHTGGRSSRRRVTLPVTKCPVDETTLCLPPIPWVHQETGQAATEQTYCDRLVQDMPFLTGLGRLSEQQVDRIILQLNRYYPQILSNKDAEKFRNPKVSLRVRLCDLLGHLQRSGERDCQEFYRALYIHAQPLHSCLPSRHALQNSDCTELDSGTAGRELSDRGPVAFLTCLGLAAGLALLVYCCPPDPKVLPGARRVLGFSPVIVDRHVSRFLLAFLTDDLGGL